MPINSYKKTRRQSPMDRPEILRVRPLNTPSKEEEVKRGRKQKRKVPSLPQEILDGMTELEQEWFHFFVDGLKDENPDLTDTDQILVLFAGIEMINMLRLDQKQLSSGELISMARQHPGVQFRSLIDLLSVSRKARKNGKSQATQDESDELAKKLIGMAKW